MKTHEQIDRRSLMLARAIAEKLDRDGDERALEKARTVQRRWCAQSPSRRHDEWAAILQRPWPEVRSALLEESEQGAQRRQNSPFCGVLSPRERWALYREFARHEA